jgi:hypothetical protein
MEQTHVCFYQSLLTPGLFKTYSTAFSQLGGHAATFPGRRLELLKRLLTALAGGSIQFPFASHPKPDKLEGL